ncbi:stage V sporulation protein E [Sporolactobacillus inulinus]|uniref:Cell division protein FtsW / stage V sporulation protein E n=2 Tax=Sporolactobacillus inulinus TaxID=2078 RepID=A0A4Y1ZC19_9BACL|nr:stage V sporulation protein E [Sporolactobacillus inulinus]KLI01804.1 stage V sporulation protein E [Sporolactobacillus inulinus CASD]GAY76481.1 cell division protein FtsW / stage V sporulation protein E [Sporolactobacillus inulinus]GEB76438.1 stage V sporulation protein E [Sporolactobacillus inulinus]
MRKYRQSPDLVLLGIVFTLVILGLTMVYSASAVKAASQFGDSLYFLKRQLLFAIVGVGLMFAVMRIDYHFWGAWAKLALIACYVLLCVVLIPGVGLARGGARSWLGVGAFSIQPSEFTKVALIIFLAKYLSEHQSSLPNFWKGLVRSFLPALLAFGLIMLQPDLGTGMVLVLTCVIMIFIAGARMKHFIMMGSLGVLGFIGLIVSAPYRMKRLTSFVDPWQDPKQGGFQIIQSLLAIGPGGLLGFGLGQSRQKYQYLPEPQTDFIFSIVSEELGFIGASFVLVLFFLLLWRGILIAIKAPDLFGTLLAVGITGMIAIQIMINIAVVTGLIPVTGITLPFLSYGGSSLTLMLVSIGILLNVSKHAH